MVRIAVVGAGIIGLSSAICIQKSVPDAKITLITEKLSPHTTGDGAAGVWSPYLLGDTPEKDVYRWAKATHDFLREQWRTEDAGLRGISMLPVMRVASEVEAEDPLWKDIVFGFRRMRQDELTVFRKPSLKTGYSFVSFTCEASKLLPYFLELFKSSGGTVVIQRVDDISSLQQEFDIVVNCTGIQANRLVPDPLVQPKRGQVMRVEAPTLKWAVLDDDDDGNYIIPNQDLVVLGGTHQEGDWNTEVYPEDTVHITDGCFRMVPSLKHAPVHKEWVGLRPGRPAVRLEMERIGISSSPGKIPFTVIHNYGHGGSGLTLFWGCALQTTDLVKNALQPNYESIKSGLRSKL
ncbi:D-aspartate oxidase [Orchesella cincta]|uniref:D-aspartate oxidase n=1 Tax=Orchesella cincta TaxID=48709 RepID=A0A1D2ND81_ORCCI|nr:D-aspartate oxidase [Orchesella cincta]